MKIHLHVRRAVPILLIGGAVTLVMRSEMTLNEMRSDRAMLLAEARELGLHIDAMGVGNGMLPTKSHQRLARENIRRQGGDVIQLVLDIQNAGYEGTGNSIETQRMKNALDASLMDLSAAQVAAFLNLLEDADEIKFSEREKLASFALRRLKDTDPVAFVDLVLHSGLMVPETIQGLAFFVWAKRDLSAAISWIEQHEDTRPDLVHQDTKRAVIAAAAPQDPELAFRLISRLSFERDWLAAEIITHQAKKPELLDPALRGLREYLASVENEGAKAEVARKGYTRLGHAMRRHGFDAMTGWLATAGLDEREFELILKGAGSRATRENQGAWIDWMTVNLPADLRNHQVNEIMTAWAEQDTHAAGTWLAQAPDSPAKQVAVRAYVLRTAHLEPEVAEQWALTLPPDAARTELLRQLHQIWPDDMKAEKEAFAVRHGIR